MTIKAKLLTNLFLTSAIMIAICLGSYSTLRYIQDRFVYMAEKSSPHQLRTVELERAMQQCSVKLLEVSAARSIPEFMQCKGDAEHALAMVDQAQVKLNLLKAVDRQIDVAREFKQIAAVLFKATDERLQNEAAALSIHEAIDRQLDESAHNLKELEQYVRTLQTTRAASFANALRNTEQYSERLRGVEDLRNQVKELQAATSAAFVTNTKTGFLIARARINSILGRITQNRHSGFVTTEIQLLTDDVREFVSLMQDAIASRQSADILNAEISLKESSERNNALQLNLNQEVELLSARLIAETKHEEIIFNQSTRANGILLNNLELVGLGLFVAAEINHLFIADNVDELLKHSEIIRAKFVHLQQLAEEEERGLRSLSATSELQILKRSLATLEMIRFRIFSAQGVVATLRQTITSRQAAEQEGDILQALVSRQSVQGKKNIADAQAEQETIMISVNRVIQENVPRVAIFGTIAVCIGMIFGYWILRSVLKPLRAIIAAVKKQTALGNEKAALAETVARGNFDIENSISKPLSLDIANHDEFGTVLRELVAMSRAQVTLDHALQDMTRSLKFNRDQETRRDRIKNGLVSLNLILREELPAEQMADQVLSFLMEYLGAGVGILYQLDEAKGMLLPLACYAVVASERLRHGFRPGEGMVGEVALQRKRLTLKELPPEYLSIASATGRHDPTTLELLPIVHNDKLAGVLEFGLFRDLTDDDELFLQRALEGVAVALLAARSRAMVADLLEQTQQQSEELRAQQEELQQSNEELLERAEILQRLQRPPGRDA